MAKFPGVLDLANLGGLGFRLDGAVGFDLSGLSVGAGDINGDGFSDIVIGAMTEGPIGAGAAYVVFGKPTGFANSLQLSALNGTDGFKLTGVGINAFTGDNVATGDVNGDGFADLIIGSYRASPNGVAGAGSTYVVLGKAGGFDSNIDLGTLNGANGFRIDGAAAGDTAGFPVATGDINGDGIADILIGAARADPNGTSSGAAYVVFGKAGGHFDATLNVTSLDGSNGFRITGAAAGDRLADISSAGDINGDGFADLIIGAPAAGPSGRTGAGESYVVFGKAGGFPADVDVSSLNGANGFKISGAEAYDFSGLFTSSLGDINGDGFADLGIGAIDASPGGNTYAGAAYVLFGKATPFAADVDLATLAAPKGFKIIGEAAYDQLGYSLSTAGDVNGDGFDDFIVGAIGKYSGTKAYVVFGKAAGFGSTLDLTSLNGSNGFKIVNSDSLGLPAPFGAAVSSAGDINGDGFADLIVGDSNVNDYAGASYVIFGLKPDTAVVRTGTNASQTLAGGDLNDVLRGLGGDDHLYGNGGNDFLDGGKGNDILIGGAGSDIAFGAEGNDIFKATIGDGNDFYYGDGGQDTVDYSALTAGINARLGDILGVGTGLVTGSQSGNDVLAAIENVIGSQAADHITGNRFDNVIDGGHGNDVLAGGDGSDAFAFKGAFGHDDITDFTVSGKAHDTLKLDHAMFSQFTTAQQLLNSAQVTQINHGHDVLITADANNSIVLEDVSLAALRAHPNDVLLI